MNKAKLLEQEQEAKPEGYVLTSKGMQAARKTEKFIGSMDDILLRVMMDSPGDPLTKDSLSEGLWQRASKVLVKLEEDGLVEEAGAEARIKLGKQQVVIEESVKPEKLKLEGLSKPKLQKLTKDVYTDRKGERLQRKRHRGWRKVQY